MVPRRNLGCGRHPHYWLPGLHGAWQRGPIYPPLCGWQLPRQHRLLPLLRLLQCKRRYRWWLRLRLLLLLVVVVSSLLHGELSQLLELLHRGQWPVLMAAIGYGLLRGRRRRHVLHIPHAWKREAFGDVCGIRNKPGH